MTASERIEGVCCWYASTKHHNGHDATNQSNDAEDEKHMLLSMRKDLKDQKPSGSRDEVYDTLPLRTSPLRVIYMSLFRVRERSLQEQ